MSFFGDPLSDKWEFSPCFESGLKRPYEKYTIWHVTPNDYDNNYGINTGGRRKEIATVRAVGGSKTTTEAVARRMAAAPDMLEALEGFVSGLEMNEGHPLMVAAVAAIAKAKGYPADGVRGDVLPIN